MRDDSRSPSTITSLSLWRIPGFKKWKDQSLLSPSPLDWSFETLNTLTIKSLVHNYLLMSLSLLMDNWKEGSDSWKMLSTKLEALSLSGKLMTQQMQPSSWIESPLALISLLIPMISVTTNPFSLERLSVSLAAKSDSFSWIKFSFLRYNLSLSLSLVMISTCSTHRNNFFPLFQYPRIQRLYLKINLIQDHDNNKLTCRRVHWWRSKMSEICSTDRKKILR